MSDAPPRWTKGILTLFPTDNGHEGTLTLDTVVFSIRAWHKVGGHVEFEFHDAEFEHIAKELAARVKG